MHTQYTLTGFCIYFTLESKEKGQKTKMLVLFITYKYSIFMHCYNTAGLTKELYLLLTSNKSARILIQRRPLSLGVFVRQEAAAACSAGSATLTQTR